MGPRNWVCCVQSRAIVDPQIQSLVGLLAAMLIPIGQDILTAISIQRGMFPLLKWNNSVEEVQKTASSCPVLCRGLVCDCISSGAAGDLH